jgi:hypothetical protein
MISNLSLMLIEEIIHINYGIIYKFICLSLSFYLLSFNGERKQVDCSNLIKVLNLVSITLIFEDGLVIGKVNYQFELKIDVLLFREGEFVNDSLEIIEVSAQIVLPPIGRVKVRFDLGELILRGLEVEEEYPVDGKLPTGFVLLRPVNRRMVLVSLHSCTYNDHLNLI